MVTVTDTVPSGLTLVSMVGAGGRVRGRRQQLYAHDPLAAGPKLSAITVTVNVAANAASQVTNQVACRRWIGFGWIQRPNHHHRRTRSEHRQDSGRGSVIAGTVIGYTVTVSNSSAVGTGTATSVTLNDPLPAGTGISWRISPAYSGPGTCSVTGAAAARRWPVASEIWRRERRRQCTSPARLRRRVARFTRIRRRPRRPTAARAVERNHYGTVFRAEPEHRQDACR